VWKGEEEEDWMRWIAGLEEESKIEDHVTIGRKESYEQDKEENPVCECDERVEEECDGDDGKSEECRARVSILLNGFDTRASLDTACWAVWVEESKFKAFGGREFTEVGEAAGADGTRLLVAGQETLTMTHMGRFSQSEGAGNADHAIKSARGSVIHEEIRHGHQFAAGEGLLLVRWSEIPRTSGTSSLGTC
jgi:hypothetical protein